MFPRHWRCLTQIYWPAGRCLLMKAVPLSVWNITTDFLKIYQNNVIWRRKYRQAANCKHTVPSSLNNSASYRSVLGFHSLPGDVSKDFRVLPQSLQANVRIVGYIKLGQGRFLSHPFRFIIHKYSYHSTPRCQTSWQTRSIIRVLDLIWRYTYRTSHQLIYRHAAALQ